MSDVVDMSPQAVVGRLRRLYSGEAADAIYPAGLVDIHLGHDRYHFIKNTLASMKFDDDDPVTAPWLSTVLTRDSVTGNWEIYRSTPLLVEIEFDGSQSGFWLWVCIDRVVPIRRMHTRADVRGAAAAFGCPLKG